MSETVNKSEAWDAVADTHAKYRQRIKELEAALKETLPIITLHNGEMSERIGKLFKKD